MVCRAAFEIVALAAGRLGETPLAAQSIIMTTDQSAYIAFIIEFLLLMLIPKVLNTLPFGIGVSASTRIGNLIGARSSTGAKTAAHTSALLSVVVGSVVMSMLLASKDVSHCFISVFFLVDECFGLGLRFSVQ